MKTFMCVIGGLVLLSILVVGCSIISGVDWFAGRSVEVIQKEIDPAELQRKYEWFKDAAAQLDAKAASVRTYQSKINKFSGLPNLDRTSREQEMIWEQELQGVKLSYNNLAAEYNASMAKWNWRFCNAGGLPQGASEVLPREFRKYLEE